MCGFKCHRQIHSEYLRLHRFWCVFRKTCRGCHISSYLQGDNVPDGMRDHACRPSLVVVRKIASGVMGKHAAVHPQRKGVSMHSTADALIASRRRVVMMRLLVAD